jgi:hypothetical protein
MRKSTNRRVAKRPRESLDDTAGHAPKQPKPVVKGAQQPGSNAARSALPRVGIYGRQEWRRL